MLYSELEQLLKEASAQEIRADDSTDTASASTETNEDIDTLITEIDCELVEKSTLEKRASRVALAKLIAAIDILQ
jgi:hypothetical protein